MDGGSAYDSQFSIGLSKFEGPFLAILISISLLTTIAPYALSLPSGQNTFDSVEYTDKSASFEPSELLSFY